MRFREILPSSQVLGGIHSQENEDFRGCEEEEAETGGPTRITLTGIQKIQRRTEKNGEGEGEEKKMENFWESTKPKN